MHAHALTQVDQRAVPNPDGDGLTDARLFDIAGLGHSSPGQQRPDLADRPDDPGAVLALVRAALDANDPAMLDEAYAVLRRAMRRLLPSPGPDADAPPSEPGRRGAVRLAGRRERRSAHRQADLAVP